MDDLIWESRVLKERAQEHHEWKMMTEAQLKSQISRLQLTLNRQKLTNAQLKKHLESLDKQINDLSTILEDTP